MEVSLIALLIFIGLLTAFLSSIINSLTNEDLNGLSEGSRTMSRYLAGLKDHFEESLNAFFIIELFFYALAGIFLGSFILDKFTGGIAYLYGIGILFFTLFILRSFLVVLGKKFSRKLAMKVTKVLILFMIFSKPLISFLVWINDRLLGKNRHDFSREDLTDLLETSREEGTLEAGEYHILKNMIRFSQVLVSDVMTPRTVIFSCAADKTVGEVISMQELKMYSRFPIWESDSLDSGVIGYVTTRDLMSAALEGKHSLKIQEFAREVYFIPENAELDKALDRFLQRRQHLFVVVDEYGGVEGILTMEDVLETMLGVEIVDEADTVVDLREYAKQKRDRRVESILQKYED